MPRPRIWLFADVLGGYGGIESYLDALARRAHLDGLDIRIAVARNGPAPFLDELAHLGIPVYDQPAVPGDRLFVRHRLLIWHVARNLRSNDWVFCVRQPMPEVYLPLVRAVHRRGAKIAASWMFSPEFLLPPPGRIGKDFRRAVAQTDLVISVSECGRDRFQDVYCYDGPVAVVRYHNREFLSHALPLPEGPPWSFAFIGRVEIAQKNLDTVLDAFALVHRKRPETFFNIYGGGPDIGRLQVQVETLGLTNSVMFHGRYDHRTDLPRILAANHIFLYTSRFEGGPCFSLLELLQAGRFVIASPVGGIPDIYVNRPDVGMLVPPDRAVPIAEAMQAALERLDAGTIEPSAIRRVYTENFTGEVAHDQWCAALELTLQPAR